MSKQCQPALLGPRSLASCDLELQQPGAPLGLGQICAHQGQVVGGAGAEAEHLPQMSVDVLCVFRRLQEGVVPLPKASRHLFLGHLPHGAGYTRGHEQEGEESEDEGFAREGATVSV